MSLSLCRLPGWLNLRLCVCPECLSSSLCEPKVIISIFVFAQNVCVCPCVSPHYRQPRDPLLPCAQVGMSNIVRVQNEYVYCCVCAQSGYADLCAPNPLPQPSSTVTCPEGLCLHRICPEWVHIFVFRMKT